MSWSDPVHGEIRDDQGISIKNPDTGLFMRYRLAGAYDSNIALLLATGQDRRASYEKCAEILRKTTLRGHDLATNLEFHFGLTTWFLANGVWAKPTTKFVVPYLTLVGLLKQEASAIDLEHAFRELQKRAVAKARSVSKEAGDATQKTLELKTTLLERPFARLVEEPHYLSAWLSEHKHDFTYKGDAIAWRKNPVEVLAETYELLHMLEQPGAPAAHVIWSHDKELLDTALGFYAKLAKRAGGADFPALEAALASDKAAFGFDAETWAKVRSAHAGYQLGLEILALLPLLARKVGFYELAVREDMTIDIPARLLEPELQAAMKKVPVPPPTMKSDEIVAASGGMFYSQEAPGMPQFVEKGSHFRAGDPLYIVEVMKMFNKVLAPFSGTVTEVLIEGNGTIVQKGQPLFKVTPDEKVVVEDPTLRAKRVRKNTDDYVAQLCG
jgi:biotin carboxyl carrier protein